MLGAGDLEGDRGDEVANDNVDETIGVGVDFGKGGAPKSAAANRFARPLDGSGGGASLALRGEKVGGLLSAASRSVMERWKGEGRSSTSALSRVRGVACGAGEGSRVSFLDGELPILLANSSTTGCVSLRPGCDALLRRPPGLPGGLRVASPDPGRGDFGGALAIPTALLAGLGFRLVFALPLPLFKQSSKQSSQHGLPRTSTMGLVPISLPHPSHLKHLECQTLPEFSTNPPSALSRRTSRPQLWHSPRDPPFTSKHGRQKNSFALVSDGYMVVSGGNGSPHPLQTKDDSVSGAWRIVPYTLARLPPAPSMLSIIVGSGESGFK